jgi:hypothetical protein
VEIEGLDKVPAHEKFKAVAMYNRHGNMIEWYWDDEPAYEDPINEGKKWTGSLLRAFSDKRVVGVKIHLEEVLDMPELRT